MDSRRRVIGLVTALLCLVVVWPFAPGALATLSAASLVGDGGVTAGFVTVTGCERGALVVEWRCHGTFAYADPGGDNGSQPSTVTPDVTVANGYRHYPDGYQVAASLRVGTHDAYRAGGAVLISAVLVVLVMLFDLALGAAALLRRPARLSYAAPVVAVVATLLAASVLWFATGAGGDRSDSPGIGPPPAVLPSPG